MSQTRVNQHPMASREPLSPHTSPQPNSMLEGASQRLRGLRDDFGNLAASLNDMADRTFGGEPSTAAGKQDRPAPAGALAALFNDIDNLEAMRDALSYQIERFRSLA